MKYFASSFCIQRKKDALESPDIQVPVVEPVPKHRRRSKEPTASSSLVIAEKRPQAAELVHESEPPDVCEVEGNPPAEQVGERAGASEEHSKVVAGKAYRKKEGTYKDREESRR